MERDTSTERIMTMAPTFEYLLRFEANDGSVAYGSISEPKPAKDLVGMQVSTLAGSIREGFTPTQQEKTVRKVCDDLQHSEWILTHIALKVLCPVPSTPIIQCIGVNYAKHAREADVRTITPSSNTPF